ncbi:MAG: tetratricopeptide repeat protein [Pelagibacterales bacterium]|nr:tetratricopeptide repeat protein [Pelagibacterales bacterium]
MATYKKRGFKKKPFSNKIEEIGQKSATANVFNTLDEGASKTEKWVADNQKYIFGLIGFIAIVVLGYFGYFKYIKEPKEVNSMDSMFVAQRLFEQALDENNDSIYRLSINGNGMKMGFLEIIDKYSGTNASNLSNYYAGISYLKLKDYKNSIKYLSQFNSDDQILSSLAKGSIGDCFVQLDQLEDALDYYEKAIDINTNDYTTAMYLLKAAHVSMELNKNKKSYNYFSRIKSDFSNTVSAENIDVFISKAKALLK